MDQRRILIVDDHEDSLIFMTYALETIGCQLFTSSTGQEAIRIAIKHQPDLILLDILLPDMDGISVLKRLRQQKQTCCICAIAVTALAHPSDRTRCIEAGFDHYLAKPLMLDKLYDLVEQNLHLSKGFGKHEKIG